MHDPSTPLPAECAGCGAPLTGPWCARCGQRVTGRASLRGFAVTAAARIFNLERGILHTMGRLTVAPGQVIRDYIGGRTIVYIHPLAYLLVSFAAFTVIATWLGGTMGGGGDRVFVAPIVLYLAGAARLVFHRAGLNYAEHLIASTFLFSHAVVMLTVGQVVVYLLQETAVVPVAPVAAAWLLLTAGYLVWGYGRIFPRRPILATLGALAALALGVVAWLSSLVPVVNLWRSLVA
jgi:hypothetical protein